MKSFFCLLLLAFIVCDVIEKKEEEIVLKDYPHELLENMVNIIVNCGENPQCYAMQISELMSKMTQDQLMEYSTFIQSPECKNVCNEIFSGKVSGYIADSYCNSLCPSY